MIPKRAQVIDAGKEAGMHKMKQEEINRILLCKALEGKRVVRLKGGDPFLFGRGAEELELLVRQKYSIRSDTWSYLRFICSCLCWNTDNPQGYFLICTYYCRTEKTGESGNRFS